jgi:hypothetical protein
MGEVAIRIARAMGGSPESWLGMQQAWDLWTAEIKYKNHPAIAPEAWAAEKSHAPLSGGLSSFAPPPWRGGRGTSSHRSPMGTHQTWSEKLRVLNLQGH